LPVVVKSIQELSAEKDKEINELKLKIGNQDDRIKALETLLKELSEKIVVIKK
jgi:uncharacterized protein YqgV (UPF0045/DUF77 family)